MSPLSRTFRRAVRGLGILLALSLPGRPCVAWFQVGLGGGGAQYAPAISPLNPNLRFVGCDMSGWYRSSDGGQSWNVLDFYQISTNEERNTC